MEKCNTMISNKITSQVLALFKQGYPFRATVREVYCTDSPPIDTLFIDFEVVGRCQNPVFDIKPIEPIRIEIYENKIPRVFVMRENFPSVPHLMCSADGKTKFLCYSDVVDEELRLRMNGRFLVECINKWFVKTARNELHHPDQPLEPFFLGHDGVIIAKSNFMSADRMFNKFVKNENGVLLQIDDNDKNRNANWYASLWLWLPASANNIIRKIPNTLIGLLGMFSNEEMLKIFQKQVLAIWTVRTNPKIFLEIFNQSIKSLLDCKCIVTLHIPLYDTKNAEMRKQDIRIFSLSEPLSQLLEIIGYRYNSKSKKLEPFTGNTDIPIKHLLLHGAFESIFARQLNGIDDSYEATRITIIGVGALGSQIFTNCIRAGFGKWTLIDNDAIWPHNLARHSLGQSSIGKFKSLELAEYAKAVLADVDVSPIVENIFNHNTSEVTTALGGADIILDVSTSIAAERVIALDVESQARRISVFLNQVGTFLTMLIEDTERSITLDLLEMQSYKILCSGEAYVNYFEIADSLAYSASCRDITSKISQDVIDISGAIVSREIKKHKLSHGANISIWKISNDKIIAQRYFAETWTVVTIDEWQICINNSLVEDMMTKRQERSPNETGGVLIGSCDSLRNKLYIVDMIFAPSDSIESPNSFIRGSDFLPEKMIEISNRTHNSLYYVGEWHSHPTRSTSMSNNDKILLSVVTEWCEADSGIGCIVIVGADNACSVHIQTSLSENPLSKLL